MEEEIKNYNPFGRGGGGAPMKDGSGNAIGRYITTIHLGEVVVRRNRPSAAT